MIDFFHKFCETLRLSKKDKNRVYTLFRKFRFRDDLFIVGGALRDFLLSRPLQDLDLVIKEDLFKSVSFFKDFLDFHLVYLSKEFQIYRLCHKNFFIDITPMLGDSIKEDLSQRDFTINAIALKIKDGFNNSQKLEFIDPFDGRRDLLEGIIRGISEENLRTDPLRILRGYRFFAEGYGEIEEKTRNWFKVYGRLLKKCAPERIFYELKKIIGSSLSYLTFKLMDEDGALSVIFPEIEKNRNIPQPGFHHLDVLSHMFESLKFAERILENPRVFLPPYFWEGIEKKAKSFEFRFKVKVASFFHDLGKGYTFGEKERDGEKRITFYSHERVGAELFKERARFLRFNSDLIEDVCLLIRSHMRPVHLLNEKLKGSLTLRAKRNLIRDVPLLEELLIVCLSDSLASRGPEKDPDYEELLLDFFEEIFRLREEIEKKEKNLRLITGHDLIALGLKPGPIFKKILQEVELKALEGKLKTKKEALSYVREHFLH